MSTLFDDLDSGGGDLYFDNLNAAPTTGDEPVIASVGTLRYQGSATITGTNFGASQGGGSVTIGGIVQPVTSWSDTSITIGPIARGTLLYGAQAVVVTSDTDGASVPSVQTFLPQTGWNYVNLTNPLATTGNRITATPDLAPGDQLAWGAIAPAGTVTVNANASFVAGTGVGSFSVECNDGTGWGGFATQFVANVAAFSGSLISSVARIQGSFAVQVPSTARTFSGSLRAGSASMGGAFLTFNGKRFSGALVAGIAQMQGSFNVIGAVVNPPAPPTPSPGGGTPASRVAIVNMAIIKLGSTNTIKSFNDDSKAARLASQSFDHIRDQELSRHYWRFAVTLRKVGEATYDEPKGPYRYAYAKPVDWLTTVWVGDQIPGTAGDRCQVHEADWSHQGDYVLSNRASPLPLWYVRRLTDPTRYHVLFIEALACRLAMEWADALTNSTTRWEKCRSEYMAAVSGARRVNAIMDPPRTLSSDSWLSARD